MVAAYRLGRSLREIAAQVGVSRELVRRRLRDARVELRPPVRGEAAWRPTRAARVLTSAEVERLRTLVGHRPSSMADTP